ncbi:hypothetical protein [Ralstonia solanacearum]|uniref:hypothetical protein n=1 Tax=Ralstonia solanacearum TaxID=305 RepID=UPI0015FD7B9D|nr:hypothetical protein [Ralstonia solanacearum]
MSLAYNARVIADARITNVSGVRGLGTGILRINVEFKQAPWTHEFQAAADILWSTLSLKSDTGNAGQLGHALPDQPVHLSPGPHGGAVYQTFAFPLSDAQLFAIEEARKGGGVELKLNLVGRGFSTQYGHQPLSDDLVFRINLSDWARVLSELGHGTVIALGVHLPNVNESPVLRAAVKLLHDANRDLVNGEYDSTVSRCRLAIESAQAVLGDDAATKAAVLTYQKQKMSMSTLQREQMIREAVRHYAHPAHHVDDQGNTERYSRSDATFLLTMAAAVVTRATARALAGHPAPTP